MSNSHRGPAGGNGGHPKTESSPEPGESRARVLIVDDSRIIRQRLISIFNPMPDVAVVGQATDLKGAMELVRSSSPNVVTLDLNLDGESGLDLLEDLKALSSSPMVIVLTNYPYPALRNRSRELGADHFITKSGEFHQVQAILEDFLETDRGRSRESRV